MTKRASKPKFLIGQVVATYGIDSPMIKIAESVRLKVGFEYRAWWSDEWISEYMLRPLTAKEAGR
jgi:hypothetical protein